MSMFAAIALGAVGLAILGVIAVAWRRSVNDDAQLPFFRMAERRGITVADMEEGMGTRQLALAVRRCAMCGGKDDCRAAFAAGQPEKAEAGCPNMDFFERARPQ